MTIVVTFLILFALKHYLADRRWQRQWMVEGKRLPRWQFVKPLAVHAGIHAILTFYVVAAVGIMLSQPWFIFLSLPCALFDFSAHFLMDRIKGVMTRPRWIIMRSPGLVRVHKSRSKRWMMAWMVIDQAFHVLTYLAIVAFLIL